MAKSTFTLLQRERFLALVALGRTVAEAAKAAGVAESTPMRWIKDGKTDAGSREAKEFAKQYEELRMDSVQLEKLTKADFDRIREEAVLGIRKLSMTQLKAMSELEHRFEHEAKPDPAQDEKPQSLGDELAAMRAKKNGS